MRACLTAQNNEDGGELRRTEEDCGETTWVGLWARGWLVASMWEKERGAEKNRKKERTGKERRWKGEGRGRRSEREDGKC